MTIKLKNGKVVECYPIRNTRMDGQNNIIFEIDGPRSNTRLACEDGCWYDIMNGTCYRPVVNYYTGILQGFTIALVGLDTTIEVNSRNIEV